MSVGPDWNPAAVSYGDVEKQSLDIWALCRRRKWLIVFMMLAAMGLGGIYYVKADRAYETSAQVLIAKLRGDSKSPLTPLEGNTGYDDSIATHILVMKSPVIVKEAIRKYKLGELNSFRDVPPQHLASHIIGNLTTGRAGGRENLDSQVIQINYRSPDVNDAMNIVKAIVGAYEDHLGETYQAVSNETVTLITQAKDELSKSLEKTTAEIAAYENQTPVKVTMHMKNDTTQAEEELKKLYGELDTLSHKRLAISALVESIEKSRSDGTPIDVLLMQIEQNDVLKRDRPADAKTAMQDLLFPLLLEHQQALSKFGPKHPRVVEIELKIQAVTQYMEGKQLDWETSQQAQISPEQHVAKYLQMLRLELGTLEVTEQKLTAEIEKTTKEVDTLKIFKNELKRRNDDRERTKRLFDTVLDKVAQINLVKDSGGFNLKTIWPPESAWQVEPVIWKVLSVAGFGGLVLGLGLAYLVDMADKSFRNPEEVRHELGVPILGHLPIIVGENRRKKGEPPTSIGDMVLTFHKPKSTTSEAYRAVRTALNFGIRGEGHKVLQITSPDPGDGKSTLSGNLAVCMAQSGKRVLLVDADFRRPRVHKLFGCESTVGLSSVIKGTADLPEAVIATEVENLYLLPCGPRPANPSELLSSSRFSEMIHVLREQYDIVLIDTPPVLAVTDPCVVAPRVDGVVLLIRITKHVRPHAKRALESLESLGANLLGIVVNGVGGVRPGVGYGFASQYGHRYATNSGYYDSYSYNYGAYHHYYDDEDEDSPTEDEVEARTHRRRGRSSTSDEG